MFLQMGAHGDKICQASSIKILTESILPMQVDGEPILLLPSEIKIEIKNQAFMLKTSDESICCKSCIC
jgi:hypothetical protein